MKFQIFLCLFLVLFALFLSSSHCYTFYVGGKEGWVLQPKEKYNDWAGRTRFQVNDTLIFKYEKGSDSVLLVKKDDYYKCETKEALMELSNGTSEFQFSHSGPFYFISGKEGHCQKGQNLITVVMAVKHHGSTPGHGPIANPPMVMPPTAEPPTAEPPRGLAPGPIANPPKGSSPGPGSAPSYGPAPAQSPYHHGPISMPPTASSPSPSSVPSQHGPTISPAPSTHHAPQYGPSQSPMPHGPIAPSPQASTPSVSSPSPSTGSVSSPPAPPQGGPSSSTPPPSGSQVPSGSQTGTPAGGSSPVPAPKNSSATVTYSSVLVLVACGLFSMVFSGGF